MDFLATLTSDSITIQTVERRGSLLDEFYTHLIFLRGRTKGRTYNNLKSGKEIKWRLNILEVSKNL